MFYTLGPMNLSEWAARVGVSKFTAYRWFREGTLPVPAQRVGRLILVDMPTEAVARGRTVIYARVSSQDQRDDLDRQVARLTQWATTQGFSVDEVVAAVIKREQNGSTGFGKGVAVPHVKHSKVKQMSGTVGRSPGGIDFAALVAPSISVESLLP